MDYFYAGQLRQYRLQFVRIFSNFKVNFGTEDSPDYKRVPCRYGDSSRIAETVVRGNSENKLLSTPFISCIVKDISMASDRRQDPMLVDKVQVNERKYDDETGHYTQDIGNRYTLERLMPVPYNLIMQVDIWTSNLNQKEQLLEQIFMLFNPSLDFQTSNNPLDWTFLSYIEMQDSITWSSRSVPVGTENPIDVLTLVFKLPIWINPPAKVKRQTIIHEIITDIIQGYKDEGDVEWSEYEFLSRRITTPGNYSIQLEYSSDNTYSIRLMTEGGDTVDPEHKPTVVKSKINPRLEPGTEFIFNNISIPITTSILSEFVDNCRTLLSKTSYAIQLHNKNSLWFINNASLDITLINSKGTPLTDLGLQETTYPGGNLSWWRLFEPYGEFNDYESYGNNASQLRIKNVIEPDTDDIVGWMSLHPVDQNRITWTTDPQSMPSITLEPIIAIIDPKKNGPGIGLSPTVTGQRYLLTDSTSQDSQAWGNISANSNDIIEYNGSDWVVVFNSELETLTKQYLINLYSGKMYMWDGINWSIFIEKRYQPGFWRLSL